MKTLLILLFIVLLSSCVTLKESQSPEMQEKRAKYAEKHGKVTNPLYDRPQKYW